jgi:hypothetical protein
MAMTNIIQRPSPAIVLNKVLRSEKLLNRVLAIKSLKRVLYCQHYSIPYAETRFFGLEDSGRGKRSVSNEGLLDDD